MNFILRVTNNKEAHAQNRILGNTYVLYKRNDYSEEDWVKLLIQYYPDIFEKSKNARRKGMGEK